MEQKILLEPDKYYHIYNHAVSCENIFVREENFAFFLQKYKQYISPVADTFAYCLMPNHFHLAVRIKSEEDLNIWRPDRFLKPRANPRPDRFLKPVRSGSALVSKQFSNFFNSYAKAFNKQQQRRGSLFERPFKRKQIDSDEYFRSLIHYIHYNPVHHGFVEDLRDWKHSSFCSFFSEKSTDLKREEVIDWFGNKDNFYLFHQKEIDEKMVLELEYVD